jgi:hypothetical protein
MPHMHDLNVCLIHHYVLLNGQSPFPLIGCRLLEQIKSERRSIVLGQPVNPSAKIDKLYRGLKSDWAGDYGPIQNT